MKVRLPLLVLDQFEAVGSPQLPRVERYFWNGDDPAFRGEEFHDGPMTTRVVLADVDEATGESVEPIEFGGTERVGRYLVPDGGPGSEADPNDRGFQTVSVLGAVLHALHLFEAPDVLGRRINWAFDEPQLVVVPRAGKRKNAYYNRASNSLKFYYFDGDANVPTVQTSMSLDIVSHETGHAILDGIAPHLYDCVSPHSLALHEAVGDLTALFASLKRRGVRTRMLEEDPEIAGMNASTAIAPAFGFYRKGTHALRELANTTQLDEIDNPRNVHALSEVLSGSIYELLVWAYHRRWDELSPDGDQAMTGRALAFAGALACRMAFRGLDYLPPGEVSFADYVRAVVAADAVFQPDDTPYRDKLIAIADRRKIGTRTELAHSKPAFVANGPIDLDLIEGDNDAALAFVEAHRSHLHIPADVDLLLEPRLAVEKTTFGGESSDGGTPSTSTHRELIVKVGWLTPEIHRGRRHEVRFGTTVVFNRDTAEIMAVLTTNPDVTIDGQMASRGLFIDHLIAQGFVDEPEDGVLTITGTTRTLHMAADDH